MNLRAITSPAISIALIGCLYGWAQAQETAASAERFAPLTAQEKLAVEKATLADTRVRALVGPGQLRVLTSEIEVDKAEAEAFLAGTSSAPPTRRVGVLVFNPKTNKAAHAWVASEKQRVLSLQSIDASDIPYSREDADRALTLAKASAAVRHAIGDTLERFVIVESGGDARVPYAAQALPLRSMNPEDACAVHRCLDLIFRTEAGYLPVRAHVDLTEGAAVVQKGGAHQ